MTDGPQTNLAAQSGKAGVFQPAVTPAGVASTASLTEVLRFFTWPRVAKILVLAGLFFWLFHGTLIRLFRVWWHHDNWSHGLVIPFFCIGILYAIRDRWLHVRPKPTYWGLAIILFALVMNLWATWWAKAIMFQDYSWWVLLVGLVVALCGWRFMRAVWFPIFFILFSIRIGGVIYYPISTKLQQIAALCATLVLRLFGIQADLTGVVINVFSRTGRQIPLQVAEACSGMKILMAFMALGALMAYMARRPLWHRLILLLATVPIAIISNVVRVAGMGVLQYVDRGDWAEGYAHTMEGMLMLPVAFVLFWLLHMVLCKLVVAEETERREAERDDRPAQRPSFRLDEAGRQVLAALASAVSGIGRAMSAPGRTLRKTLRKLGELGPEFREQHFAVVGGLMLVAAISWNVVNTVTGAFFAKASVPLKQALDRFPREIARADGSRWVMDENWVKQAGVLKPDVEKYLGARHPTRIRDGKTADEVPKDDATLLISPQYIQRAYRLVTQDSPNTFDKRGMVLFFISYYTGEPDVVPHVPERCYLGGGYTENVSASGYPELEIAGRKIGVRRVQFHGRSTVEPPSNVIYFFGFNGQFSGRHEVVRMKLNSPLGDRAYYAKIEVKFPYIEDPIMHQEAVEGLLNDFLPILIRDFLPDWEESKS